MEMLVLKKEALQMVKSPIDKYSSIFQRMMRSVFTLKIQLRGPNDDDYVE